MKKVPFGITAPPCMEFLCRYAKYHGDGSAIKRLKFHTCYLFSSYTKQELPDPGFDLANEQPGILAGGWVYKRCKRVLAGLGAFRSAVDILYCKYGMPNAGAEFVASSLKAHAASFGTKAPPVPQEDSVLSESDRKTKIQEKIDEICELIYGGSKVRLSHRVPSTSACYEAGCKTGGQLTELLYGFAAYYSTVHESFSTNDLYEDELVKMTPTYEVRRRTFDAELLDNWQDYVDTQVGEGPVRAEQVPILEPRKVRVITKGPAADT